MNLKRTTTLGIVGGALAAWLAGAATSVRTPPPVVVARPPIEMRGAELASEVARLHEHLRPTTSPRQPGRNLFTFRAAPARLVATPVVPAAPAAIVEAPAPAPIALTLAGISEDPGDAGPVRMAFISAPGQPLFMVKEGESVTPRYRVTKISVDVVELTDVADGSIRRLALK